MLTHNLRIFLTVADFCSITETVKSIDLVNNVENLIFCRAGLETVLKQLPSEQKIDFSRSLLVQNAETVVRMVEEKNGIGIISKFTLSSILHRLQICPITPTLNMQIGLIANDLNDLTPTAQEFTQMLRELCNKTLNF